MKKKHLAGFVLCILIVVSIIYGKPFETKDNSAENISSSQVISEPSYTFQINTNEPDFETALYVLLHQPYIDAENIEIFYSSEREDIIMQILEAIKLDPIKIRWNDATLFKNGYYSETASDIYSLYYGTLKDGKPEGFGVISSSYLDESDYKTLYGLYFAGNFKDGRFNGYGTLFNNTANVIAYVDSTRMAGINEDLLQLYLANFLTKEGKWKNGDLAGNANLFDFYLFFDLPRDALDFLEYDNPSSILIQNSPTNYWAKSIYPTITTTNYKNGDINGDTRIFAYNTLLYDGKMEKNEPNGKGTSYYTNGLTFYTGNWKNGHYDGKGTLYDPEGNEIYSGKWDRGDIAS